MDKISRTLEVQGKLQQVDRKSRVGPEPLPGFPRQVGPQTLSANSSSVAVE